MTLLLLGPEQQPNVTAQAEVPTPLLVRQVNNSYPPTNPTFRNVSTIGKCGLVFGVPNGRVPPPKQPFCNGHPPGKLMKQPQWKGTFMPVVSSLGEDRVRDTISKIPNTQPATSSISYGGPTGGGNSGGRCVKRGPLDQQHERQTLAGKFLCEQFDGQLRSLLKEYEVPRDKSGGS